MRILFVLFSCMLFTGCIQLWNPSPGPSGPGYVPQKVWGYKPVYNYDPNYRKISYESTPRSVVNAGKIYAKGSTIFQNEIGEGIHVIDNSNPNNAKRIGFIVLKGSTEISIQGEYLYSNSFNDLVVAQFISSTTVTEVKRVPNAFPSGWRAYPLYTPPSFGPYQCPEFGKEVTSWIQDSIYATCYK
jgi:hypothetical protein